jgi:hypothetical protein
MTSQFRALSTYRGVSPASLAGLDGFDPTVAPGNAWPLADGSAGRTCRTSHPLLHGRWLPVWGAPLGEAAAPTSLLVGGGFIVAEGRSRCLWDAQGCPMAQIPSGSRASWLDPDGSRLLSDGSEGGLGSRSVPSLAIECSIMLSLPSGHLTGALLPGPDRTLLVLTRKRTPRGPNDVVVEVVRARDWQHIEDGRLYGLDPIAGMIREQDCFAEVALAKTGPVLATPDGVLWCDWQLRPLAECPHSLHPRALSVDAAGRAFIVGNDDPLESRVLVVPPGGPAVARHSVPSARDFDVQPPLILPHGASYVLSPGELLALSPAGQAMWRQPCGNHPRGTTTANGLLLLADEVLYAVDPAGQRMLLWTPPSPLVVPPILLDGRIVVATSDQLFMLHGYS